jgi:hypothetical protein
MHHREAPHILTALASTTDGSADWREHPRRKAHQVGAEYREHNKPEDKASSYWSSGVLGSGIDGNAPMRDNPALERTGRAEHSL